MEMEYFYQLQHAGSAIAAIVLCIGAYLGCRRASNIWTMFQLGGAMLMVIVAVMSYALVFPVDLKTGRMEMAWLWRLEQIVSFAGLLFFSLGYLIERINTGEKL